MRVRIDYCSYLYRKSSVAECNTNVPKYFTIMFPDGKNITVQKHILFTSATLTYVIFVLYMIIWSDCEKNLCNDAIAYCETDASQKWLIMPVDIYSVSDRLQKIVSYCYSLSNHLYPPRRLRFCSCEFCLLTG